MPTSEASVFHAIYEAHFDFVWRTVRRLGVAESAIDDAVQEVFLVVFRRLAQCSDVSKVRSWLYAIMINVARASRRATSRAERELAQEENDLVSQSIAHPGPGPEELRARTEALAALELMLASLSEEKLEIFVLVEIEELPVKEAAKLLGLNVNTAQARLRDARLAINEAARRFQARDTWRLR